MRFVRRTYHDLTDALELMEFNGEYEEPWAMLSVNTGVRPPLGNYWIKTWSENEKTVKALIDEGYLEPTGEKIACGFSFAIACKLTPKARAFTKREE